MLTCPANTKCPLVEIPDVKTHASCYCYQKGDEQTIWQHLFVVGKNEPLHLKAHHIVFILEGSVRISTHYSRDEKVTVGAGDFVFLPIGTRLEYAALESGSMLLVRLDKAIGSIPECHTFRFQRDHAPLAERQQAQMIWPLRVNERIRYFLEGTLATERDGLKCSSYAKLLVGQLLFLIHVYYTQEEYTRFYSTMFTPDIVFSDLVYQNVGKCLSVAELANSAGLSLQQFIMRFRRVFGEPPGVWMKRRKAADIYYDICSSHKTLKSIAAEYSFSMSNFIRYCRMNFGRGPTAIREALKSSRQTG